MARGDSYQLQGQQGGTVYNGTDPAVGPFRQIVIVNDAVFSAFSSENLTDASTKLITITHVAGTVIGGVTASFTMASGVVIAYDQ